MGAVIVAALVVAGLLVGSGTAATPAGGQVELWGAAGGNSNSQRVVFVGAIGDYGTATNVNKNGKPNPNGNFVKIKLRKGAFMLDATSVNKSINSGTPQVESHATCSAAFSGTGVATFMNGTGQYKGISGTANVTVTFGGVGDRYKSGPKKGQCKQGDSSPRASFGFVAGQGTVSFAA
jgi:hypothetical protein